MVLYGAVNAPDKVKKCLDTALRILARRDHSCFELSAKLLERGFVQDHIQWVVDECLRLDYLDDSRYAVTYTEKLMRKGYGSRRIKQVLAAKGVSSRIITICLDSLCHNNAEIRTCRQALLIKISRNRSDAASAAAKARLYRFLLGRGFEPDIIRQVMEEQGMA